MDVYTKILIQNLCLLSLIGFTVWWTQSPAPMLAVIFLFKSSPEANQVYKAQKMKELQKDESIHSIDQTDSSGSQSISRPEGYTGSTRKDSLINIWSRGGKRK